MNNYEKDGKPIYNTVVFVENITFEESQAVTKARADARAAAEAAAEAPAQA